MQSQIDHNILCDAADAVTAHVFAKKGDVRSETLQIPNFTPNQLRQGIDFAVRLGYLEFVPDSSQK